MSNFFSRTVFSIVAVGLCYFGFGLTGMVLATFAQLAVFALLTGVAARRRFGSLFIAPWRWERSVIRNLFALGGWIQLTNACSTIVVESNRFIISAFVSTSAVTYFEVASRLTRVARSIPFNFIVALLPAVSARNAALPDDEFNATYVRASRYVNYATIFLVGFIIAAGKVLSFAWIGTIYPHIGLIVLLVGLSFIFINVTMVGTTMLRAIALAKYETYYYAVWTAASIALMMATVPFFGMNGVLGGMVGGAAIGAAYFLTLLHRLRDLPAWQSFFAWALPLAAVGSIAIGVTAAVANLLGVHGSRIAACGTLVELLAVYCVVFAAGTFACRFFNGSDVALLGRILPPRFARRLSRYASSAPA